MATDELGLAPGFFLSPGQLGLVDDGSDWRDWDGWRGAHLSGFTALNEGAFFAHFHLDRAGFARRVGLFDLRGGFLHERDFFTLRHRHGGAVRGLQKSQQFLFIRVRQFIVWIGFGQSR